jgi:hypothetical protein
VKKLVCALALAVGIATTSCGEEEAAAPPPPVKISTSPPMSVKAKTITVTGRVTPSSAKLTIDDLPIPLEHGGTFRETLNLKVGANEFNVQARAPGRKADRMVLRIDRSLTAKEITARREAARQRRIHEAEARERRRQEQMAREAQAREDFIASAQTIDYDQLAKSPDDYKGTKVAYTGQIFQIQEDYGATWMLLSVTDMGYDIWDDNIWVEYPGEIEGADEDIITIYGVVKGEESYETQIGGETYVPKVVAKYVSE